MALRRLSEWVSVIAAYILVQTEAGKAAIVAAALRDLPGVSETASLAGPYDVIARAQARNIDELAKLVTSQVQALDGVSRTMRPHHHSRSGRGRRPGGLLMRLAQSGVRHRQDGRNDGLTAARGQCRRSARVGDVPAITGATGPAQGRAERRSGRPAS